jgi:CRISPR system Cascade subunit CasB
VDLRFAEATDLWGLLEIESVYEAGLPEADTKRAEEAVHLAVTLWALHQQTHRCTAMHEQRGHQLGSAVRQLRGTHVEQPLRKRLVRAGTATSFDVLARQLRQIVVLLRGASQPLDYGVLADQLHLWQRCGGPDHVRRAWGSSFHAPRARPGAATPSDTDKETA